MKVLTLRRWAELEAGERNRILERATSQILDPKLLESIGRIYADVAARGDAAVADATERFDGVRVDPNALLVDEAALDKAHASLPPALLDAIRFAIASVRAFNEAQRAASPDWRREIRPGVEVGERMRPIPSAGLFVPCGQGFVPVGPRDDRHSGSRGRGARDHGRRATDAGYGQGRPWRPRDREGARDSARPAGERAGRRCGGRARHGHDPARREDRRAGQPGCHGRPGPGSDPRRRYEYALRPV